jgi:Thiol-disulfide isomerase and thioredoxins
MKKGLCMLLCMLLCLTVGCTASKNGTSGEAPVINPIPAAPDDEPVPTEPPQQGDLVFDTVTLYGDPISSDMLHEYDLVVVNFWADWCGWCVYEMPSLQRIHQEHPNVLILGVLTAPNSMADSMQILADNGITFPTLEPAGTLVTYANRLEAFPTTLFFDSHGNECADPIVGAQDYDGWAATIEGLLP